MEPYPSVGGADQAPACERRSHSESVSEELVVSLWTCTKCGHRFETKACMPAAEPKMSEKDWEQMFPPLLVA